MVFSSQFFSGGPVDSPFNQSKGAWRLRDPILALGHVLAGQGGEKQQIRVIMEVEHRIAEWLIGIHK